MAEVRLTVNEQTYAVSCGDGQEDRVKALAAYFDGHVQRIAREFGRSGEARVLILAALNLADELFVAHERLESAPPDGATIALLLEDAAARIEACAAELSDTDAAPR